jgi:excisionase family DNA binding protein
MESKLFTVDEVAAQLGMHHKTIRKFITEGKLTAAKVGKQWRISGHDLSVFLEKNEQKCEGIDTVSYSTEENAEKKPELKISVSSVVDINGIGPDEYTRISNMLLAIMNTGDPVMRKSTINMKYYADEKKLRIMLWGSVEYVENMLGSIAVLAEQ